MSTLRLCLVTLSVSMAAFAQTGTIQGILTDPQGGVIPNAKVTATDEAKSLVVRETTTSIDGRFRLANLLPGRYTLRSEVSGFKALERTGLQLDQNQLMDLGAVALQVGQTSESVTVEAVVPLVETATANKSFVISSRQVTELSLNGRDFQSLMRTLPGVVSNDRSDFRLAFNNTDAFNVNGLRGSNNNVFLDGTINTDVGANDGQYTQISLDAVGEFKVQTSTFNAEYGRNPGILIAINTKSGTKRFHGTGYEFVRNNAFDARLPFDTTGTTQKLRFNQFGGNIGGPIMLPRVSSRKDPRMFFFFNYEGTRATRPIGGNFIDLPNPELLTGNLSRQLRDQPLLTAGGQNTGFRVGQIFRPGTVVREAGGRIIGGDPYPNNIVPRSEWSANAPAFLKTMSFFDVTGAPQTPGSPELVRFPYQQQYGFRKDGKVIRYDWNISSNANFFFRWADDAQQENQSLGIFTTHPTAIFPQYRKKPGSSWSWNLVNVISPTTTNEFIFGYNRLTQVVDVIDGTPQAQYDKTSLGFKFQELYPESNVRNRFPRFNCGVGSCNYTGFPAGWASDARQFAWTDNFTKNHGAHTFKVGGFVNMNNNGQQPSWTDVPSFNFGSNPENPRDTGNTFANMLLGNYTSVSQTNGRFYGAFRFFGLEWYAQDSWKVNRKLSLEFGIRWAYLGPTYTRGQYLQNYFDPGRFDASKAVRIDTASGLRNGSIVANSGDPFNGIVQENTNGIPAGFAKHRYNNWGPRFGFAWDPFGDGKTSVRGGAGIFYERIRQNANNFDGLGNPPLVYTPTVYAGRVDELGPALISQGVRFPVGLSSFDPAGQIPTIYSWSFGIQRELGRQTTLDASYIGNGGRFLQYRRDLNQLDLGTTLRPGVLTAVNGTTNALRPYRGYTGINFTEFGGVSNYNAMQLRVTRRFAQGFTGNFNYTWSKAFGEVDGDTTAIGYYKDRRREYGPAGFDRTHIVTIDFVYELPKVFRSSGVGSTILNGWQVNGITRFWSGPPATITANGNVGTLGGGQRANYVGGDVFPATRTRRDYFNVTAFARPLEGDLGNLGKNTRRLPGINQWDISLLKNFRAGERFNVQFRFETFNTFNHTQWAGVNTGLGVPNPGAVPTEATRGSFGEVNSTRDPRSLQFGLKFLF
ncbi:MAG: carboxypeptidase regulatory-like domain-containing protein [Bryobacteraceae bacterium]